MTTIIKLLLLEDNPDDAWLIESTLKRGGLNLECKIVGTREEFTDALATFVPQIVISDHQLAHFSSFEALQMCRATFPHIPFILVTGAVTDEVAGSLFENDANGYVLKDDVSALPQVIRHALSKKQARGLTGTDSKTIVERYEILSKATNDAIWDWDIINDREIWNRGIQRVFGYDETPVRDKEWWRSKVYSGDRDRVSSEMDAAFMGKAVNWVSRYQYLCSDGSYKYVLDRAFILYDDQGRPLRMVGAMQDVTAEKNAITEIERMALAAVTTNNGVIITDPETKVVWVNKAFTSMTGYTLDELKGLKPGGFLMGPETDLATVKRIGILLSHHQPVIAEIINYSKAGRKYWIRLSIAPAFDDHGELSHFIGIQTDITLQKDFEKNIVSIARELSGSMENANTPIFGADRNGYINEWNKVTADLTGYSKNEVLGRKLKGNLIEGACHDRFQQILDDVLSGQSASNLEIPFVTKDNKRLIILLNATPRKNSNQEIIGILIVGQNITELTEYRLSLESKVLERTRELNDALNKEREIVELKSKFVSIASHEFRSPLSTISIVSAILRKHREKISRAEFERGIDTIDKQVQHMTYMLDDILTIGKADSGQIDTAYSDIPIESFFKQIVAEIGQNTTTHKIKLKIKCPVKAFSTDEKLLRNIVINLLTNAIKFSPGSKSVSMTIECSSNLLKIEVRDQGIGIMDVDLPNIFSSFQRGGNVGKIPGTGLGLSIVKRAVDILRGNIQIKSGKKPGSVITVILPMSKPHDA